VRPSGSPSCLTGNCNGGGSAPTTPQPATYDADTDGFTSGSFTKCGSCNGTTEKTSASGQEDCCDSDGLAKPGQSNWYTVANDCGDFDYDCSGVPEKYYTGTFYPAAGASVLPASSAVHRSVRGRTLLRGCLPELLHLQLPSGSCVGQFEQRTQRCH